jgi:hypothetical protein
MIQWLHRYIFKGLGIVMLVGVITILYLAINFGAHQGPQKRTGSPTANPR